MTSQVTDAHQHTRCVREYGYGGNTRRYFTDCRKVALPQTFDYTIAAHFQNAVVIIGEAFAIVHLIERFTPQSDGGTEPMQNVRQETTWLRGVCRPVRNTHRAGCDQCRTQEWCCIR